MRGELSRLVRRAVTLTDVVVCVAICALLLLVLVSCRKKAAERASNVPAAGWSRLEEKDRRARCKRNLQQLARALETYMSDYGGYYPCQPAYGRPWNAEKPYRDVGLYQDPLIGQTIRTAGRAYYAGPSRYRCMFYGSRMEDAVGREVLPFAQGNLNVAPIGMGFLLALGYHPSAEELFCPSATVVPKMQGYGALTILPEFQRTGETGGRVTHGDFSWAESYYQGQSDRGILSSYNYRNAPLAVGGKASVEKVWVTVPYTRPRVSTAAGCPMFKTPKLLGSRAFISDSSDKPSKPEWEKAFAYYAHREGYNVLYGDYHVAWYGDPDEQIMNTPWPESPPTDASQGSDVCYMPENPLKNIAFGIWHRFDEAAGVDVGVAR